MSISVQIGGAGDYGAGAHQGYRPRGQDVADAAYHTAHGYPGGVAALAVRMGVSENTLTHKVNPNNNTHILGLKEAVAMQVLSGNPAILHAMAEALGYACTPIAPAQDGGDPVDAMARMQVAMADFMRAVADAVRAGEGGVTPNQARRADHFAQELIACTGHTMAMLRARMRPAPEAIA